MQMSTRGGITFAATHRSTILEMLNSLLKVRKNPEALIEILENAMDQMFAGQINPAQLCFCRSNKTNETATEETIGNIDLHTFGTLDLTRIFYLLFTIISTTLLVTFGCIQCICPDHFRRNATETENVEETVSPMEEERTENRYISLVDMRPITQSAPASPHHPTAPPRFPLILPEEAIAPAHSALSSLNAVTMTLIPRRKHDSSSGSDSSASPPRPTRKKKILWEKKEGRKYVMKIHLIMTKLCSTHVRPIIFVKRP